MKVSFPLEADAWHGNVAENMWAEKIGGDRYRLRNSPFYVHGVSMGDVVFAEAEKDGRLVFGGVSIRGGHSTYRIMLKSPAENSAFLKFWNPIEALGCRYEGVEGKLLAIDVPPSADIHEMYGLLEAGEQADVWEFEEGHCGHAVDEATEGS